MRSRETSSPSRSGPLRAAAGLVLLGLILSGACARVDRPHAIVLVTFDTLSLRFAGPYSEEVDFTPNLNRMAAEGVLFERAYTRVPITLPAHASLLTGIEPPALSVMVNGDFLGGGPASLPAILSSQGYGTAGFVSLGVLKEEFGIARGFDHFDDEFEQQLGRWYRRADEVFEPARRWIRDNGAKPFFVWVHLSDPHEPYLAPGYGPDAALRLDGEELGRWNLTSRERHQVELSLAPGVHRLEWISLRQPRPDDKQGKTALYVELRDPEALGPWLSDPATPMRGEKRLFQPWEIALTNRGSQTVALPLEFSGGVKEPPRSEIFEQYRLEVALSDRYLGELEALLEELGVADEALWILASDHGEGLRYHGVIGHSTYAWEDQMRVLWIMRGPDLPEGMRIGRGPALLEDVMPTLLEHLGIPAPDGLTGISQAGCWRRGGCPAREEWWSYGASNRRRKVTAVAAYRWPYKLLWMDSRRGGFFDLEQDPWEQRNLGLEYKAGTLQPVADFGDLNRAFPSGAEALDLALSRTSGAELSPEQQEMLRSLGYLADGS